MKLELYNMLSRRTVLKGAAAASALAATGTIGMPPVSKAYAASDLRAAMLKIPGVGAGQPTDADWQKVGGMCLEPTKANVAEGEFKGVELSFMGLNNQNVHNVLFRGLSKAWADYTGATINWIDLAQADYNSRLQQSIATGTVDFDVIEMGAPFEGDVCGKGLASVMPDWVAKQIEMDDYVSYLKAAGRHLGRQDLPHFMRWRLPQFQLPFGRVRRCGPGGRVEGIGWGGRLGSAQDLAAGQCLYQVPEGQEARRTGSLWLSRSVQGLGRFRFLLPW